MEDRALLAGNVSAQITGGMLRLGGDSLGNQVLVEQTAPGSVLLTPLDGTTTINGSAAPVALTGFRSGLFLSADGGDDVFRFAGAAGGSFNVSGAAVLHTGNGNDILQLDGLQVGSALIVNTGAGNDTLDIRRSSVRVGVLVGGNGGDTLNSVGNVFRIRPVVVQFENNVQIDSPVALGDTATVETGGTVNIDLAANDQPAAALDLTSIVITSDPANGDVTVNGDGTVTYTHDGSATTSDSFRYTIEDASGRVSNEAEVSLTVDPDTTPPTNEPPTISAVADLATTVNVATGPISVTLDDDTTADAAITLTGSSSNTTLVPNANIAITGTGSTRTVIVTPAANQTGNATITLTATDANNATATETFVLTVNPLNAPPTITAVADATVNNNAQLGPLDVTLGDAETPVGALQLTAASSNQAIIANSGIQLGGAGSGRTVTITPVAGASGTATVTLTVTDAANATATETFVVTVNGAPTITNIGDQTIAEDGTTGSLAVTVGDDFTAAGSLALAASSSNTTLIPNANIQLGGSGSDRTVLITPVANASGSSTITLTATDAGGLTVSDTFTVTVNAANDAPTIDPVADVTANVDSQVGPVAVTIGDPETPAASLSLAATSSNQAVVSASGIQLGGSGEARTILITPVAGATGSTTVTLTVTDANSATATETFVVTINGAPTISDVADQTTAEDTATAALAVNVGDDLTADAALVLAATSSNTAVVPNENIELAGSGSARTVVVTPAAGATGSAVITLIVTDEGGLTATDQFTLNVTPANDPPVVLPELFTAIENSGLIVSGNLLINDNDGGDGGPLTITALSNGSVGSPFLGLSGTFQVNADGSFTFDLDDTIAAIDQLMAGQELFEELQYTVSDGIDTTIGTLRMRIQGAAG